MPFDSVRSIGEGCGAGARAQPPWVSAGTPPNRRRIAGRSAGHSGRSAEERARRWYLARGGEILAERWRPGRDYGGGEVDLIVRIGGVVAFVEVKARRSLAVAACSVSEAQWRRLEAAALRFMMTTETGEADIRFDVALCGRDGTMEVVENARMT